MTPGHEGPAPTTPAALVTHWKNEAVSLRGWGAHDLADAVDRCAAQLDALLVDREAKGGAHG